MRKPTTRQLLLLLIVACVSLSVLLPRALAQDSSLASETSGAASSLSTRTSPISPSTPIPTPTTAAANTPGSPSNTAAVTQLTKLVPHAIPEIHATICIPEDWSLLQGNLLDGGVLLATKEKIASEDDIWATGLSMSIDRNGAKDSDQKASVYALTMAREALEKAGEEASPLKESLEGVFHVIRFDFPVQGDQSLLVTEELRANDGTGTVAVILWQMPKDAPHPLEGLRDSILTNLKLDPTQ